MTAFASHFAFEFKTGLRNSSAMLMNYLFPIGLLRYDGSGHDPDQPGVQGRARPGDGDLRHHGQQPARPARTAGGFT